jgi:hypothetical protein
MVNKKNTFNIKAMKKTAAFKKLKYSNKIIYHEQLEELKNNNQYEGCLSMAPASVKPKPPK